MTKANDIGKSWVQGSGDVFVESLSNQEKSILLAWAYGGVWEEVLDDYIYIRNARQICSRHSVDINRAILNIVGYDDYYSYPPFAWEIMQNAFRILPNGSRLIADWLVHSMVSGESYRDTHTSLFDTLILFGAYDGKVTYRMLATVLGEGYDNNGADWK